MMLESIQYMHEHMDDDLKHWNGGICEAQKEWLHSVLRTCKDADQRCIVACHHPIVRSHADVVMLCVSCRTNFSPQLIPGAHPSWLCVCRSQGGQHIVPGAHRSWKAC